MRTHLSFDAIGTAWQIEMGGAHPSPMLEEKINDEIARFDLHFSRFREDSWVSRIRRASGTYSLPPYGAKLLGFYERLYRASDGLMTPLIGKTLEQAGYDASYSLVPSALTTPPNWDEALNYDDDTITLRQPVLLDFGAAGKGLLVDIIAELLLSEGLDEFIVNAGGDIRYHGNEDATIQVGLENPFDVSQAIGVYELSNESICASSGAKRAWAGYNHILNPSTLRSVDDIQATWVVSNSAMVADGISTALFFTEPSRLKLAENYKYLRVGKHGEIEKSADFNATLFQEER